MDTYINCLKSCTGSFFKKSKNSPENGFKSHPNDFNAIELPPCSLFSSAFQSAQLAPLVREFDLGDEAVTVATAGDMEAFVKALQKNKSKDGDGDKKKDEPEDMALD